jgi:hypothetical protein
MTENGEGDAVYMFSKAVDFDGITPEELSKVAVSLRLSADSPKAAVIEAYRAYRRMELEAALDPGC